MAAECRRRGSRAEVIAADLAEVDVPARLVDAAAAAGRLAGLVLSHCESVDSSILDTTVASWERHFAVNARAAWLLIRAFAERLPADPTTEVQGRIIALTSDHAVHNLPYGASKGALDRIVVAAAVELASRGIRANVIHPTNCNTPMLQSEPTYRSFRPDLEHPTRADAEPVFGVQQAMKIPYIEPEDISNAVLWLASDEARYVTGMQLRVDAGGYLKWYDYTN